MFDRVNTRAEHFFRTFNTFAVWESTLSLYNPHNQLSFSALTKLSRAIILSVTDLLDHCTADGWDCKMNRIKSKTRDRKYRERPPPADQRNRYNNDERFASEFLIWNPSIPLTHRRSYSPAVATSRSTFAGYNARTCKLSRTNDRSATSYTLRGACPRVAALPRTCRNARRA